MVFLLKYDDAIHTTDLLEFSPFAIVILHVIFLARDAFVRTNCCAIAMMLVCLSVRPFVWTGVQVHVHHDRTVHFSTDLSLWLDSQCYGHSDIKACQPTPSRLFPVSCGREVGY